MALWMPFSAFPMPPPEALEIYGTKGSIQAKFTIGQLPGGEMIAFLVPEGLAYDADQSKESDGCEKQEITAEPKNMYTAETEYLSDCIINNKAPEINTGEDAIHIAKVTAAVYQAAEKKKTIKV